MKQRKIIFIFLLVLCTMLLGYLREYVFVSINDQTGQGISGEGKLYFWKWPLTGAFALSYFLLTWAFLFVLFRKKIFMMVAFYVYALLLATATLVGLAGALFFSLETVYPFIRSVLGLAQSPVPLLALVAVVYSYNRLFPEKKIF